jgi:hypothetical protein
MNVYRADLVGKNGHIASSRAFVCANDDHAIVWAKQLAEGDGVELWCGNRFVFRLNAAGKSDSHEVRDGRMVPKSARRP